MMLKNKEINKVKICLVTEELSGLGFPGGIGAAFYELAVMLEKNNFQIDILYCPIGNEFKLEDKKNKITLEFARKNIKLQFFEANIWVNEPITYEKKSYAISQWFESKENYYEFIHFHDYKGLGYFTCKLKKQGLALLDTKIILQLHGTTRWTIQTNNTFFTHEDQLKIDFMERESIKNCDAVVSPSAYFIDWLTNNGYCLPAEVLNIKNIYSSIVSNKQKNTVGQSRRITDLIFFGRHEDRKGFLTACEALDLIEEELFKRNIIVTFIGKFGIINGHPSGIHIGEKAKKWKFKFKIRTGLNRDQSALYIQNRVNAILIIPSIEENSPYSILESIAMGMPVISSIDGGGKELFKSSEYAGLTKINSKDLAKKIISSIDTKLKPAEAAETTLEVEAKWINFHLNYSKKKNDTSKPIEKLHNKPLVSLIITHYERPRKLMDAIFSVIAQTYKNLEIIVVDDGSENKSTILALLQIENILNKVNGKLLRKENAYLGAARNAGIKQAKGEYICFLDDDDLAKNDLIETLVTAAINTQKKVITCLNIYMPESIRGQVLSGDPTTPTKVDYIPIGGPLSVAANENCLGASTSLFSKKTLLEMGGYSEIYGVGHEDYELYLRLIQNGNTIEVVPKALYYYEVDRPSMLTKTSLIKNFQRCFNALDFSVNSLEWKDYVSMTMGKQVIINSHNRTYWQYSHYDSSQIRHKILTSNIDRKEMLNLLSELADVEKWGVLKDVFLDDLNSNEHDFAEPHDDKNTYSFEFIDEPTLPSCNTELIYCEFLEPRLDIILKRYNEAAFKINILIKKTPTVNHELLVLANELINIFDSGDVNIELLHDLFFCIKNARINLDNEPIANIIMAKLSIIFSNEIILQNIIKKNLQVEESFYIDCYPDIKFEVSNKTFISGLHHYILFGYLEQRSGFDLVKNLLFFSANRQSLKTFLDRNLNKLCNF
jgi:glycosyltransferase involved in cell wall biosynthesis